MILLGFEVLESILLKCIKICVSCVLKKLLSLYLSNVSSAPFVEERGRVLITLVNEIQIKLSTVNKIFLLDVFISFIEFPTCEPLTQFICKSGRCISSKWHCDSGKYQMFTVLYWFDWGLAVCAGSLFQRWFVGEACRDKQNDYEKWWEGSWHTNGD